MRKRYAYLLLFGIPGFFVAGIAAFMIFGAIAGASWLFLFGDKEWPAVTNILFPVVFLTVFLVAWSATLAWGYITGKRFESEPAFNRRHIALSACTVAGCVLLILIQQLSVHNIGPKTPEMRCSEICAAKGFRGSGMPPANSGDATCTCYDVSGRAALSVPMR